MGREIGRKHDSLIGFAEGTTQEPNPTTRKRLEALYRVWGPVLKEKSEIPVLHFKGLMMDLGDLLPDDLEEIEAVLRATIGTPTEGEDPRAAALRPHLLRVLLKMADTAYALHHRYDKQAYTPKKAKKRAPRKRKPDAPDYLAGIPPGEGVEEPKPKRRGKKPPPAPEEPK